MRSNQVLLIMSVVLLAMAVPSAGAAPSEGGVEIDFTLHPDGAGTFVSMSGSGFFDCSGTFNDLFVGSLIEFTEDHVIIENERRDMRCDFHVDFPVAPDCVQHSDVEWIVADGTGAFAGWQGSRIFDSDIAFEWDGEEAVSATSGMSCGSDRSSSRVSRSVSAIRASPITRSRAERASAV